MLTNLPAYCRNAESTCETSIIDELTYNKYYSPKGRPAYSSKALRFALIMRYTSLSAYRYLQKFIPLPSLSLLYKLSASGIDTSQGLISLRDNSNFGNDVILLLDEMYLQQEVQYDGRELIGCNVEHGLYKSIICFMVVSLKQSTPYVLKGIPFTKIDHYIVQDGIMNCLSILSNGLFNTRAIISDNHPTNVSAFKHLRELYPC